MPDDCPDGLDLATAIPAHVAIVMDGNGRWAKRRGLKRTDGHTAAEEALFDTVEGALDDRAAVDDRVRVLDRELAPADRRGALPACASTRALLLRRRDDLQRARRARPRSSAGGAVGCRAGCCATSRTPRRSPPRNRRDDAHLRVQLRRAGRARRRRCARSRPRCRGPRSTPTAIDERTIAPPPLRARHARPRPARAHLGRVPHLQLPPLGGGLLRVRVHRRRCGPTSAAPTSSTPSPSSSAASAASAPSTPRLEHGAGARPSSYTAGELHW